MKTVIVIKLHLIDHWHNTDKQACRKKKSVPVMGSPLLPSS